MKAGEGAGHFLADLALHVPDEEMRRRYRAGEYGKLRPDWVKFSRQWVGRV